MRAKGGGINSGMNLKLHLSLPTLQSLLVPIELNDSYLPRTWSESPPHPHIGVQSAMQRRVWGLPSLLTLKLVHIFYNSLACGGLCGESRYRSSSIIEFSLMQACGQNLLLPLQEMLLGIPRLMQYTLVEHAQPGLKALPADNSLGPGKLLLQVVRIRPAHLSFQPCLLKPLAPLS